VVATNYVYSVAKPDGPSIGFPSKKDNKQLAS
jgi:hypothetical protein